uniref:Uncharacterized protein n=1 Tax=Candidozyma auris TaxID=498019 RepID=A0A0L0P328_CANAR
MAGSFTLFRSEGSVATADAFFIIRAGDKNKKCCKEKKRIGRIKKLKRADVKEGV